MNEDSGLAVHDRPPSRQMNDVEHLIRRDDAGSLYAVERGVYNDPAIYELELRNAFKQQWVFVGLEVEVPEPGCYKATYLADVPVVIVRDENERLHVFENVCVHRGAKLVRNRCGKSKSFKCMYHSWTYDLEGRLTGVPLAKGFNQSFKKSDFSLSELPRVETYSGLIFASYNSNIESLSDYIGDFGPYVEEMLDGGKIELLGYQRYHVKANWKLFVENTIDAYHPGLLHMPILKDRAGYKYKSGQGHNYKFKNGHGLLQWPVSIMPASEWDPERDLPLTLCLTRESGWDYVSNIFPNIMVLSIEDILTIRQLIPRGVDQVDIITYNLALPHESDEIKRHRAWVVSSQFGIAGVASLDDKLAMEAVQAGSTARHKDTVLLRGDLADSVGDLTAEISLRGFYEKWVECLNH